jgi:hypothetical protein
MKSIKALPAEKNRVTAEPALYRCRDGAYDDRLGSNLLYFRIQGEKTQEGIKGL